MRYVRNCLGDPSLHLLGIALILIYLAFGEGSRFPDHRADEPLAFCRKCHVHHLPNKPCDCGLHRKIANARP